MALLPQAVRKVPQQQVVWQAWRRSTNMLLPRGAERGWRQGLQSVQRLPGPRHGQAAASPSR